MSCRLLLVESDPDVAIVLGIVCEGLGCEILTAATLGEARALLADSAPPDLLVLDLFAADGSALDFCREARTGRQSLPIVALSTDARAECEAAARAAGADYFFAEPFDPEALAETIRRLVKGAP